MTATERMARFQRHLSLGSLLELPDWSLLGGLPLSAKLEAVHAAGVTGLQTLSASQAPSGAFTLVGIGAIRTPAEADAIAARHRAEGFSFSTVTAGLGFETDAEMDALAGALLEAAARHGHPLYLETHRGSITQDIFRTLRLVERFPDLRFNADLSHWYTGHELGNDAALFQMKLERLEPIFSRVRYVHGRIGTSCCMQAAIDGPDDPRPFVSHFKDMWRRCFSGFLAHAEPEAWIGFAPELLPAALTLGDRTIELNYARMFQGPDGALREESDRWAQSLHLYGLAEAAFAEALDQQGAVAGGAHG